MSGASRSTWKAETPCPSMPGSVAAKIKSSSITAAFAAQTFRSLKRYPAVSDSGNASMVSLATKRDN